MAKLATPYYMIEKKEVIIILEFAKNVYCLLFTVSRLSYQNWLVGIFEYFMLEN